ncbi:DUF4085 family protein [Sutcliffiella cohnii]
MWHISKEAKEKFLKCNLLPIQEEDEHWEIALREAEEEGEDIFTRLKEELDEVKEQLLQTLPSRFIPYVKDGTLNKPTLPKHVRDDYVQWMREADKEFEQVLDAAYEQTKVAITYLPQAVQEVFQESLHDAVIQQIIRDDKSLQLIINTDGGFSTKSLIHLHFKNVISEETNHPIEVGQWFIYDELQKRDNSFAFRVLFECPESEWTITMESLDANYFYRPSLYTKLRDEEKLAETTFESYVSELNGEYRYWFITPDVSCAIQSLTPNIQFENGMIEFFGNEYVVTVGSERFSYHLDEQNPIDFIYTDIYEDPYAHLSEPVLVEDLEEAALSDNLDFQVRAWNTMYGNAKELSSIINNVLLKVQMTEENEMLLSVYTNHFYKEGILSENVIEKFRDLIEFE